MKKANGFSPKEIRYISASLRDDGLLALKEAGFISRTPSFSNGQGQLSWEESEMVYGVVNALVSRTLLLGEVPAAKVRENDEALFSTLQHTQKPSNPALTCEKLTQVLDASVKQTVSRLTRDAEPLALNPQDEDSLWTSLPNTRGAIQR